MQMKEKILPYKCKCGGILKTSHTEVEFFGIDFGIHDCEVCTKCNSEYLSDEVMERIEEEAKKYKLFGLEKNISITKSGNSLVVRIPPDIARFTNLHYQDRARIFPTQKNKIEIEVSS